MSQAAAEGRFTAGIRSLDGEAQELTTIGIDIGSSTTHFTISRLFLASRGTRFVVVRREPLRSSAILLTPYDGAERIDVPAIRRFLDAEFVSSGLGRDDIDTGAIILTGAALARRNARLAGELFAEEVGRFVVASAGDRLEATLAAYGSGAAALSARACARVLHVDVGGGTTKFATCDNGSVRSTAALEVGARLVTIDEGGRLSQVSSRARETGARLGFDLRVGDRMPPAVAERISAYLADRITEVVLDGAVSQEAVGMMLSPGLENARPPDIVTFSGGVSEYIYGREAVGFGDLGIELGRAIRSRMARAGVKMVDLPGGIRSTVIGASQYTVQVSSQTIFVEPVAVLPVRNVPVILPEIGLQDPEVNSEDVRVRVERELRLRDLSNIRGPVAVGISWTGQATSARLRGLCRGLVSGMGQTWSGTAPAVVVTDADIGGVLGLHLRDALPSGTPLVSVDGIEVRGFDFIDIGPVKMRTGTTDVIVKSLLFTADSRPADGMPGTSRR